MDYFEGSQEIKKQIETSQDLMEILRKHVSKGSAEFIGGAKYHRHYHIGRLSSGLLVATRESNLTKYLYEDLPDGGFRGFSVPRNFDEIVEKLEEYCQRAEFEFQVGRYTVTSFCVGVRYKSESDWRGLILVEDLRREGIPRGFSGDEIEVDGQVIRFDLTIDDIIDDDSLKFKSDIIHGIKFFESRNLIEIV